MAKRNRGLKAAAGAMIVLGAGALLQPAGAARADASSGGQTPASNATTGGHTGHYTRKKLPGRMKSGQKIEPATGGTTSDKVSPTVSKY